jgi:hypothetical protein
MTCRVEPLKVPRVKTVFTEADLAIRESQPTASRRRRYRAA